jgi:hypothetical protein
MPDRLLVRSGPETDDVASRPDASLNNQPQQESPGRCRGFFDGSAVSPDQYFATTGPPNR